MTVRNRGVSWLSSRFHEWRTDCQGTPARNARIVAVDSVTAEAREPDRTAPEGLLQLGGQRRRRAATAQAGREEAGVVHRPVPAASAQVVAVVVAVLRDQQVVGTED